MGVAHVQLDILDYIEVREMERWGGGVRVRRKEEREEGGRERRKKKRGRGEIWHPEYVLCIYIY